MSIRSLLEKHPLFRMFGEAALDALAAAGQVKTFAPGETIIAYGQPGEHMGFIASGKAAVLSEEGKLIGWIKEGDLLGEMSLLTGEPTSANVVAEEECRVVLIPHFAMSAQLTTAPQVIQKIGQTITQRLRSREANPEEMARVRRAWLAAAAPADLRVRAAMQPIKVLVINCGSSSLKYDLFDTANEMNNAGGIVERIGEPQARHRYQSRRGKVDLTFGKVDHAGALSVALGALTDPAHGVIKELSEITAVGHRVVHGGERFSHPVEINQEVIDAIQAMIPLAPLHNPVNLLGIQAAQRALPKARHVAVFDTAFHQTMPQHAFIYALPYELYEKHHIRRYGFHGTSHQYVGMQAAAFMKRPFEESKIITCHLGNGASICAIDHGRSIDTTMGMTPLEGLVMGTRSGDLDPAVIPFLARTTGASIEQIDRMLNKESGLLGLSGISNDMREIQHAASQGNFRALLALQVFCYRIRKYIGAYIAALGGLDALVFTAGIGENCGDVRARVCQGLSYMGIILDEIKNSAPQFGATGVADVSDERSRVRVLVIRTDEQRMIARETIRALGHKNVDQIIERQAARPIPIGVSARHVHLSKEHVEALFGPGYKLTPKAPLSQPGQFACEETVSLIGPKSRIDNVRVLGPARDLTQVEIARTDEFRLGVDAPIRASGDIKGSPGITIEGPAGKITIPEGTICALRHIHMTPEDALAFGLRDKDRVMVRVPGERPVIFGDTLVRVSPNFKLEMHLDTDEANAAEVNTGMTAYIVGVEERK